VQEVYDWFELGEREGFITHSARVVAWMRGHDAVRYPHLCQCRAADPGCIYAVCNQTGVCLYPEADGSRCSLIMRGEQ
jgi:hypothetical protein